MMLSSSETQWNIDMHRASTFHSLHQAVVIKEAAGTSSGTSSGTTDMISGRRSPDSVRRTAERELERLKNLPPSSYKWTWGESLTKSEVLALQRPGEKGIHSGYNVDLKDGKLAFEDTPPPSWPETCPEQDGAMADDTDAPPDNNISTIRNFKKITQVYDPLGKRRETHVFPYNRAASISRDPNRHNLVPRISANLTRENVLILDKEETVFDEENRAEVGAEVVAEMVAEALENVAPDYGNVGTTITGGIEDMWESESDGKDDKMVGSDVGLAAKIDNPPDTPIEDMWASGTQADNDTTPLEDIWVSDSNIAQNPEPKGIEDDWPSGTEDDNFPAGQVDFTVTGIEDEWPSPSEHNSPAPGTGSYRRYGPDDFSYLQNHMFEEKLSDSESEDDYYE
jgi:hypothetical protein